MIVLQILGAIVALGVGIWFGLPRRGEQTPEDLDRLMGQSDLRLPRRAKRHFTPMAWMQRNMRVKEPPSMQRRAFQLDTPNQPRRKDEDRPFRLETPKQPDGPGEASPPPTED